MGALQMALADMAVDLEVISLDATPGSDEWKRYLAGDRAVFARNLAGAIDNEAIDRITALYREDENFHAAAECLYGRVRSAAGACPRRRWRRAAHFLHLSSRYRQDLSGDRLCAGPAPLYYAPAGKRLQLAA